jgi:hypothetical protein
MVDSVTEARKRQTARLDGVRPPTARKAMALAKSKAYQDGADAEATLRAYATDVANFEAWCGKHGFAAMPATPETVGAYLEAAEEGYAMPKLRRWIAAIARAHGVAGHPLDTKHPAIRETLRGISRKHGSAPRRAAALTTTEVRKLCRACGTGLAAAWDRSPRGPGWVPTTWPVTSQSNSMRMAARCCFTDGFSNPLCIASM